MKSMLATFNSDQVNNYGYRFDVKTLESMLRATWKNRPMFLSHDFHRPVGISRALALHLHASQALLKGVASYVESAAEQDAVVEMARAFLSNKLEEIDDTVRAEFTALLGEHLSADAPLIRRECVTVLDKGIVRRLLPSLFVADETDKRALTSIHELTAIGPGVYRVGEFAVYAHAYFRRSLSQLNNLNGPFLERLYALRERKELSVTIRLDADSIGLASTYLTPLELERWRGPKFNDDLTAIELGTVTVHKAPDRIRYFHGVERTEFWWHRLDDKNSFECEEVLDAASLGIDEDTFGCRYAHSMMDDVTNLPDHLDGAIREYAAEPFLERIEVDISKAGKKSRYVKLWKVDGPLQLTTWKELICDYFRGNPLPGEYLKGEPEPSDLAQEILPKCDVIPSKLYPFQLGGDRSAHVAVAYHDVTSFDSTGDRSLESFESFYQADSFFKVVELTSLEFVKSVNARFSGTLTRQAGLSFIDFHDCDVNLPAILLRGNNALEDAEAVLECLLVVCQRYVTQAHRRLVTATIGVRYDQTMILFSFAGPAPRLCQLLSTDAVKLPRRLEEVGSWCSKIKEYLRQVDPDAPLTADGFRLLNAVGCFIRDRSFEITGQITTTEAGPSFRLPPSEAAVAQAMYEGILHAVPAVLVQRCRCSCCGGSYFDCDCSTLFQNDCVAAPEDFEILSFFLTDNPAQRVFRYENHRSDGRFPATFEMPLLDVGTLVAE